MDTIVVYDVQRSFISDKCEICYDIDVDSECDLNY